MDRTPAANPSQATAAANIGPAPGPGTLPGGDTPVAATETIAISSQQPAANWRRRQPPATSGDGTRKPESPVSPRYDAMMRSCWRRLR